MSLFFHDPCSHAYIKNRFHSSVFKVVLARMIVTCKENMLLQPLDARLLNSEQYRSYIYIHLKAQSLHT